MSTKRFFGKGDSDDAIVQALLADGSLDLTEDEAREIAANISDEEGPALRVATDHALAASRYAQHADPSGWLGVAKALAHLERSGPDPHEQRLIALATMHGVLALAEEQRRTNELLQQLLGNQQD